MYSNSISQRLFFYFVFGRAQNQAVVCYSDKKQGVITFRPHGCNWTKK
jgi:hypothetical protein